MSAIVPTVGHRFLVEFVRELAERRGAVPAVIVSRFEEEPTGFFERSRGLDVPEGVQLVPHYPEEDVPPEPRGPDDQEFWEKWREETNRVFRGMFDRDVEPTDVLVTSEPYGVPYAGVLGCQFVTCDVARSVVPVRGTDVRRDLCGNFDLVAPRFANMFLKVKATIFGAESCGKTTLWRNLREQWFHESDATYVPEYAREYLETVGPELTDEKMLNIIDGQLAFQQIADRIPRQFQIQDTDLFSTLGYYELWGRRAPLELRQLALENQSDVYFAMPDHVPFEPDPLRYGGDRREGDAAWWRAFADRCDLNVVEVPAGIPEAQLTFVIDELERMQREKFEPYEKYERPR
jgi:NadR type nicotinamide-nucleotide adenylyltransferase